MRVAPLALAAALSSATLALAAAPALRLEQWAGRYSRSFSNGLVDGERYRSRDIVEIRPVDASHADIALSLDFYNGHSCWIDGRAQVEGDRLVLNLPEYSGEDGPPCRLELWKTRSELRWSDGENSCKSGCGMRGTFSSGAVPLRSKRRLPAKPLSAE